VAIAIADVSNSREHREIRCGSLEDGTGGRQSRLRIKYISRVLLCSIASTYVGDVVCQSDGVCVGVDADVGDYDSL
jgi:hypothetical protein